jgi:hypothetical protein
VIDELAAPGRRHVHTLLMRLRREENEHAQSFP